VTTIAAPSRRARPSSRSTSTRTTARRPARDTTRAPAAKPRVAARPLAIGRVGALLALVTVFALVTAVVFHVVLAQHQMELDRLNVQIAKEQRIYEKRHLAASVLASPPRVIQEAERLGLVRPQEPAQYLQVPGAPMPTADDGSTSETIADWSKTKASLGPQQP
jgi:cell division protein FtsL